MFRDRIISVRSAVIVGLGLGIVISLLRYFSFGNEIHTDIYLRGDQHTIKRFDEVDSTRLSKPVADTNRPTSRLHTQTPTNELITNVDRCSVQNQHRKTRFDEVNINRLSRTGPDAKCTPLRIKKPTPICVHNSTVDLVVSSKILKTGVWEGELIRIFTSALQRYPADIVVLDIGCNIGIYTLAAAMDGYDVVAVDANPENLRLLSKSLTLGNLTNGVTLIRNAISDTRGTVSLHVRPANAGENSIAPRKGKVYDGVVNVQSILLDDIECLFTNRPVAIKMDVEMAEHQVLKGGLSFFKNVDVRFIQMELLHHGGKESALEIVSILSSFGFKPFKNCLGGTRIDGLTVINTPPQDVCFIKMDV